MNGYQGNLEKHLQQSLFKSRSGSVSSLANPLLTYGSNQRLHTPGQASTSQSYSSTSPLTNESYGTLGTQNPQSTLPPVPKPTNPGAWEKKDTSQLHPAIRQEYNSVFHNQYQPAHPQYQPPPSTSYSSPSPTYQMQRPQQGPLAPPSQYYQQPYQPQGSPTNGPSPHNSSFLQTPQQHQPPSNSQPYQPQYQTQPQPQYQENKLVYAHQQYFQKPQAPFAASVPYSDLPDVPADSTSLIERMMVNLRKATSSSSNP